MAQVTGGDPHKYVVMRFDDCLRDAHRLLMQAADEWAEGNPEEPPTMKVLNDILDVFVDRKLLTRPYGSNREDS